MHNLFVKSSLAGCFSLLFLYLLSVKLYYIMIIIRRLQQFKCVVCVCVYVIYSEFALPLNAGLSVCFCCIYNENDVEIEAN